MTAAARKIARDRFELLNGITEADGNPNGIPREIRKGTPAIRIENGHGAGTPTLTRNVCVAKLRIAQRAGTGPIKDTRAGN